MSRVLRNYTEKAETPQMERARVDQVRNDAGGYGFQVTPLARFRRFLVLGVDGGTYYVNEKKHAKDSIDFVKSFIESDGPMAVSTIVEISSQGRAPKNSPALFALAAATVFGNDITRSLAYGALPQVARIGTHLFEFLDYRKNLEGGWGRGVRSAVARWYTERPVDRLAYQVVKYRQRYGWSHRDVLRLAHPKAATAEYRALFDWVTKSNIGDNLPSHVEGFIKVQEANDAEAASLIVAKYGLPWEAVPTQFHNEAVLWDTLIDNDQLPIGAAIRQLPRLTNLEIASSKVVAILGDQERLRKGRVHPITILVAMANYKNGVSRGSTTWTPNSKYVDALDAAFYAAFPNVEPAGKRTLVGIDVSGSMGVKIGPGITARDAATAMAMVQAATEPEFQAMAFSTSFVPLDMSPRRRLDDVVRETSRMRFGGTDCSLPMLYALKNGLEVDTFAVYTDSETWAGSMHPFEAIKKYREETGIPARLVAAATAGSWNTIADPTDAGMLDVDGFDAAVPKLIADFSAGRV